jgi:hypothetical protein
MSQTTSRREKEKRSGKETLYVLLEVGSLLDGVLKGWLRTNRLS